MLVNRIKSKVEQSYFSIETHKYYQNAFENKLITLS